MSQKNSKFSGIFSQAREREAAMPDKEKPENEANESADDALSNTKFESTAMPADTSTTTKSAKNTAKNAPSKIAEAPQISPENTLQAPIDAFDIPKSDTEIAAQTASIGRPRGKRSNPNYTQITAYISKSTHQNIKIALLNEGEKREISELIEAQLLLWLSQNQN